MSESSDKSEPRISARLDGAFDAALDRYCKAEDIPRTSAVKRALRKLIPKRFFRAPAAPKALRATRRK